MFINKIAFVESIMGKKASNADNINGKITLVVRSGKYKIGKYLNSLLLSNALILTLTLV